MRVSIDGALITSLLPASMVLQYLYTPDIPMMLLWLVVWYGAVAIVFMEKEKK